MEILDVKQYPLRILRKKCKPVRGITREDTALFDRMLHTMKYYRGVGLAAPQIGISKQLIVANIGEGAVKLANPRIVQRSGIDEMEEGCLSVPEKRVNVKRTYKIVVEGLNNNGKTVEIKAEGLLARVLQHEIDHLSGKLIIDYLPFFERINYKVRARF
ncbi:MAG: peptide deformylase [Endomicrobiales bacterium]|nr:peptide deformylase [Endomicrobiales bacterium]